ncbi:MAG: hypothetical protein H0T89_23955 [Deltaproteobacteria bacterium]|nr:hypothetical protein [Deltaproteobacteria bacterium]MDQ3298400.1 hypothetical protein [Myxococcota bacterium]
MRSTTTLLMGLAFATGCASTTGSSHGVTHREHVGSIQVVFTNASPETMCALHMSFEDQKDFGDNWLPEAGLPTGQSVEFKVKPGKYKATWNTCKTSESKPYYAGTKIGELGIEVDQQTQLFAYIADTIAPTKRAPALGRDYKLVRFQGQAIETIARTAPAKVDAFAAAQADLASRSNAKPAPAAEPVAAAEPAKPDAKPAKLDARDLVDPKARRTTKRGMKPTLDRKHDVAAASVKYGTR